MVSFLFKYRPSLFEKSQFGFGASLSPLWIVLILLLVAALIYFLYIRVNIRLSPAWRAALLSIRALLIALIVFVLMRPVIVAPSVVPGSSYVAVLMDDSASMKLADEGDTTRLEAVRQVMSPTSRFYAELSDKFKIREYKFSSSAQRISDSQELTGEGAGTDLAAALEHASRDMAGLPLSGIVVMSDGASNTEDAAKLERVIASLRSRGLPVFAVGVGRERIEGDVEIVRATAPRRALAGSPISAEAIVRASGLDRKTIRIDIAEDDRPLRSQDVPAPQDSTSVARITFTPSTPGVHRYRLTAVNSDDPVAENNSQEVVIEVEDAHPKILYLEGEPRWEYGKMREAVAEEKNVVLVSLLRSADGKYYRQGVESAEDLAAGFPKSEEELFKYDALIIGSVEATFFSFDQLRAIEQFVLRRGGSLIALGGAKSFSAGGYQNTPFADLLPVYLGAQPPPPSETQTFKAYPSDRG
ncbi:MAG: VWA domain-containing protein, partial [Acidobacteriota bacterium]